MSRETVIEVPILARVEGEDALDLKIKDGKIDKCELRIYKPPRYFEKFLEGREPNAIIDVVARICVFVLLHTKQASQELMKVLLVSLELNGLTICVY